MNNIKQKKCKNCKGSGLAQIAPNVRGLETCKVCGGTGKVNTGIR